MRLTECEKQILDGNNGPTLRKIMKIMIDYGQAVGADRLVDIEGPGHLAIPWALPGVGARLEMVDELAATGLKAKYPFTLDPRSPLDFGNLGLNSRQEETFKKIFCGQGLYDRRIAELGLRDEAAYTCTPYLPEVGNIPEKGMILAWAESSCIVYVNSILGARTNRTATIMDLLSNILGKTPLIGFLTDEGRRANWLIEVRTSELPDPQLLGGAIGKRVLDEVPYIVGLDRFFACGINDENIDYFKEMGAACAAIGAVGLYHVEGITPEAVEQGRDLLNSGYSTCVIDDQELDNVFNSYPIMWERKDLKPKKCFIGCPHLSLRQLYWWVDHIDNALKIKGTESVVVDTVLCAAPQVVEKFKDDRDAFERLKRAGVRISSTCAEMYMNNQLCAREPVVTNSNKLRAYTTARMFLNDDLVEIIVNGYLRENK